MSGLASASAGAVSGIETAQQNSDQPTTRFSIRSKFLLMMLITSMLSLGTITLLAYQSGQQALTDAALKHLTSVKAAKKQQIEFYFKSLHDNFRVIADTPTVTRALDEFSSAFQQLGKKPLSPERMKTLETFYNEQFLPELAKNTDEIVSIGDVFPNRPAAQELQTMFIAENSHPMGQKARLSRSPSETAYATVHARHHAWFQNVAAKMNFSDLLLINEAGDIVYSVGKEIELGAKVGEGIIAGSNLGRLTRDLMKSRQRGDVQIADFAFHIPSLNAPTSFVGATLFKDNVFVGAIVAQISISALGTFVNDGGKWREQGLGETGAVFLVGPDRLIRSDHRMVLETKDKFLADVVKSGIVKQQVADRMKRQNSTVLYYPISKAVADPPLAGRSGTEIRVSQLGVGALFSYAPLDLPDLNWAIVARMDQSEVFASQIDFNRKVMIAACTLALIGTLAALWLAGLFLRPVQALLRGIELLKSGKRDVIVGNTTRDEFSELVRAFNGMAATIKERDQVIEAKTEAYEQLLKRIFPETVAYRLKQGEAAIVETFPQVTVIYAIIDGFSTFAETQSGDEAIKLLNDIVDRMDDVAEAKGVEKVKTIGDHYLAVSGLSVARLDNASRALDFAREAWRELSVVNQANGTKFGLRVGIATGTAQAGMVGSRRFVFDIWGSAVSSARRIVYEADLNSVRLNSQAVELLTDNSGLGEELVITTKSLGPIRTCQLRFAGPAVEKAAE